MGSGLGQANPESPLHTNQKNNLSGQTRQESRKRKIIMEKLLLNQKQAAEALGVSTKTISRSDLEPIETRGSNKMFSLEQLINFEAERRAILKLAMHCRSLVVA